MAKTRGNLNLLSIYIYLKYIKHVGGFVIHQTYSSIKYQLTWKGYSLLTQLFSSYYLIKIVQTIINKTIIIS